MEFSTYPSKDLILPTFGILALFLKALEFLCYPSTANIRILPYFYKHSNTYFILPNPGILAFSYRFFFSYAILLNTGIMALFLYTLVFWSYSLKPWNSSAISVGIGILILSFYRLVFWPFFYKHWNYDLTHPNIGIVILSFHYKHWNCGPILLSVKILALFL